MIVIGIIGSPAGGKSTVAGRLRELGATWINADRLAHRCLDRSQVRDKLVDRFGRKILHKDGRIDRPALGAIVFGDDAEGSSALDYLQSVIHPMARHLTLIRLSRAARCNLPAAILDAPLLLEADWGVMCDAIWCVDAPRQLREQWIKQRGWTPDELHRRENRQLPISEKRRLSTNVIHNDTDLASLLLETETLWFRLMQAAGNDTDGNDRKSGESKPGQSKHDGPKISSLYDESSHCLKYFSHNDGL